ncbi:hypothetical protein PanWU01x14_023190, partial [Parasponia andersonii]
MEVVDVGKRQAEWFTIGVSVCLLIGRLANPNCLGLDRNQKPSPPPTLRALIGMP